MIRVCVSVVFSVALSASAAGQTVEGSSVDPSVPSVSQAASGTNVQPIGDRVDGPRFDLQVYYLSYARQDDWQRLKAAGLTDLEAVRFLLTNPRGADPAP